MSYRRSPNKFYDCVVYDCEDVELCEIRFKSIYQVIKFLESCNFPECEVRILTPKNVVFLGSELIDMWRLS